MGRLSSANAEILRRLTLADERYIADVLGGRGTAPADTALDARIQALVRVGALIALGASATTIDHAVADAIAAGASCGDVVEVLLTVASAVGTARTVSAAPRIAMALGYDVGAAMEAFDDAP